MLSFREERKPEQQDQPSSSFSELEQLQQLMLRRRVFDLMTTKNKKLSIKDRLAGQIVIESDIYGVAGMI